MPPLSHTQHQELGWEVRRGRLAASFALDESLLPVCSPLTLPVQTGLAGDSSWWVTPLGSQHGYWADPSSHCPIASLVRAPRGSVSGAFPRKHHVSLKKNQRLGENLETVCFFIRKERARRRSEANEPGPVLPPLVTYLPYRTPLVCSSPASRGLQTEVAKDSTGAARAGCRLPRGQDPE